MPTVDVPKDANGDDLPVLGLYEHPEHGGKVWAHTPADEVQFQAEGWKLVDTAKQQKAAPIEKQQGVSGGGK